MKQWRSTLVVFVLILAVGGLFGAFYPHVWAGSDDAGELGTVLEVIALLNTRY